MPPMTLPMTKRFLGRVKIIEVLATRPRDCHNPVDRLIRPKVVLLHSSCSSSQYLVLRKIGKQSRQSNERWDNAAKCSSRAATAGEQVQVIPNTALVKLLFHSSCVIPVKPYLDSKNKRATSRMSA